MVEDVFVMKRTNNYLPGYDKATRRAEFAAFLSLGIVAAPVMLYAVYQSFGFSVEQPSVVAALERSATHLTAVAGAGEVKGSATNLAVVNSQTHRTMVRVPGPKT